MGNIDECAPNPCKNGGTCKDGVNSFTCTCAAGYSGDTCETNINECASNPCKNGGTCHDGVNSFTCTCATGYSGSTCETKDLFYKIIGDSTCEAHGMVTITDQTKCQIAAEPWANRNFVP